LVLPQWAEEIERNEEKYHNRSAKFSTVGITMLLWGLILTFILTYPSWVSPPSLPLSIFYTIVAVYGLYLLRNPIVPPPKVSLHEKLAAHLYLIADEIPKTQGNPDELAKAKRNIKRTLIIIENSKKGMEDTPLAFGSALDNLKTLGKLLGQVREFISRTMNPEQIPPITSGLEAIGNQVYLDKSVISRDIGTLISTQVYNLGQFLPSPVPPPSGISLRGIASNFWVRMVVQGLASLGFGYLLGTDRTSQATIAIALLALMFAAEGVVRSRSKANRNLQGPGSRLASS